MTITITILGIRHHGVGSATHVLRRLQEIQPDMIMIEGPPEITDVLKYVGHEGLVPPVSIMVYDQSEPKTSVFYPFSSFSPEWVAAEYANKNGVALRALDMPAAVNLQMKSDIVIQEKSSSETDEQNKDESESPDAVLMSTRFQPGVLAPPVNRVASCASSVRISMSWASSIHIVPP